MLHPKKRPSRKSSGINVFSSANTAEGAATDFDRVPFYRKMRPQKSLILNFLKGIISSLIYKVNRKELFRHYAQNQRVVGARKSKNGIFLKIPYVTAMATKIQMGQRGIFSETASFPDFIKLIAIAEK